MGKGYLKFSGSLLYSELTKTSTALAYLAVTGVLSAARRYIGQETMNSNNYHAQANVFAEILKKYIYNAKKSKYFAQ